MLNSGFYVTAELKIIEEAKIFEARNALQTLCTTTLQQEPECSLFQLHQCQHDATRLLLWERFDSEQAYHAHFEQPHTREYLSKKLTEVIQHYISDIIE